MTVPETHLGRQQLVHAVQIPKSRRVGAPQQRDKHERHVITGHGCVQPGWLLLLLLLWSCVGSILLVTRTTPAQKAQRFLSNRERLAGLLL